MVRLAHLQVGIHLFLSLTKISFIFTRWKFLFFWIFIGNGSYWDRLRVQIPTQNHENITGPRPQNTFRIVMCTSALRITNANRLSSNLTRTTCLSAIAWKIPSPQREHLYFYLPLFKGDFHLKCLLLGSQGEHTLWLNFNVAVHCGRVNLGGNVKAFNSYSFAWLSMY